MNTVKGRVKKLSIDKETGEVFGLQLDGVEGYFSYSKEEFRGMPWDKHPVASVVEIGYNTQVKDDGTSKRWVKTITRLDGEAEDVPFDDYVPWEDESGERMVGVLTTQLTPDAVAKAAKVAEVESAEDKRNRSISRQVAAKCAAEVVVAMIPFWSAVPESERSDLSTLIDTVLERFLLGVE